MTDHIKDLVTQRINRRDFIIGLLAGGGGVLFGSALVNKLDVMIENEPLPTLDNYSVTRTIDQFLLFTNVGQTLAPRLRGLTEYQQVESKIFNVILGHKFILYGNDYAARFQKHYKNNSVLIPPDRDISNKFLMEAIQDYPHAWSQIIYTMFMYSPDVAKAYLIKGKS